jgi:TonB family protein
MFARTAEKRFGALGRMGLVAAIHVAALFVIARSLGIVPKIDVAPPEDMHTTIIDRERPPEPPLVPTDYRPENNVQVVVPVPEVLASESETPLASITADLLPIEEIPIGPGSADPEPVSLVNVRADPRRPLSQPPYPASLIRNGTEGSVDVEVFVQPSGRVADARIVRSSGHELFDRATLDEARRNWRLLPATRNGEPYAQWYRLRVVFKLKNQQ